MIETNVAAAGTEKFPMIKEASALDIFFEIIYTKVSKLLAAMLIIV